MRKPITDLIHHSYQPPAHFAAPQPGVHRASTVFFADVAAMRARDWKTKAGYTYGLHGTPTTFTLEERLATLEGATACLLVPSGLAALALVAFALLKTGDEVLIPNNAYGPNKALATGELANFGITGRRLLVNGRTGAPGQQQGQDQRQARIKGFHGALGTGQ